MKSISASIAYILWDQGIIQKEDINKCRYGLDIFISSALEIVSILIIAAVIGNFLQTLLLFAAFIPLRIYAGGYHSDTKLKCYLVSLGVYGIFTIVMQLLSAEIYLIVAVSATVFSMLMILIAAPIIHKNKSVNDIERKKQYKKDIVSAIHKMKLPFLKKRKVLKLVQSLCDLQFLLDESEQTELMLNEEVWSSDCLEYNVNQVYEFILQNSIESQSVDTQVICKCCQVESDMDIKYIKMNDTLRKSKEDNPIIVLVNDMFVQPFVINGNHRIKKAFNSGIDKIEVYILDADNVNHCLISEDYRTAYEIYKKLHQLVGMLLNC